MRTCQHDERRRGVERVSGRQQHRDGRDGTDARKDADQRAQQTPEERIEQVLQGEGDGEACAEVLEKIHGQVRCVWATFAVSGGS